MEVVASARQLLDWRIIRRAPAQGQARHIIGLQGVPRELTNGVEDLGNHISRWFSLPLLDCALQPTVTVGLIAFIKSLGNPVCEQDQTVVAGQLDLSTGVRGARQQSEWGAGPLKSLQALFASSQNHWRVMPAIAVSERSGG